MINQQISEFIKMSLTEKGQVKELHVQMIE